MNLKSFIIASLLIHFVGGIGLYFYYNPIKFDSESMNSIQTEEVATKDEKLIPSISKKSRSVKIDKKKPKQQPKPSEINSEEPPPEAPKELVAIEVPEAPEVSKIVEITETPEAISAPKTIEITETPEATSAPKIIKIAEAPDNSIPQSQVKITKDIKTELNSENKIMAFSSLKQKLGNPSLSYPDFAREREMQGLISLLFFVDENGLVDKIQLEKSSGYSELDNFVLRVLSQYRFLENQSGWVRYEQNFILEGEEKQYLRLRQEEE